MQQCVGNSPKVSGKKGFCYNRRKKRPSVCNVTGEAEPRCKHSHSFIIVASGQQVIGVEDVEPPERQPLANVVYGRAWTELVINTPVAVRESCPARHRLKGGAIFLNQVLILRIVVWNSPVENRA